jgi:hypothetical protein
MGIDERTRHKLYLRLEDVLGAEEATALMEHLPPTDWADVATKHDLLQLEGRIDLRLESLEHRLAAAFREELNKQMRALMLMYSGLAVGVGGLVLAAVRLV